MSRKIDWEKTVPIWEANPKIIAAWAFGSAQDGVVREGGDVDTAVLTTTPLTFDEQLTLLGQLQHALQMDELDLVVLNNANPILRFEAVSGKRLFCRDLSAMAGFVSLTAREYEDEMAQWRKAVQGYNVNS